MRDILSQIRVVIVVENLYSFKQDLDKHGTVLCFSGIITQEVLATFAEVVETKLQEGFAHMTVARNIFAVFVELTQNIMSYSSDSTAVAEGRRESPGIIIIGYHADKGKFFIKSGNSIRADQQEKISSRIDSVKNLSSEDLKVAYKEARKSGKNSHERGGGLGFIEIQRKCSEPLEYRFDKIDDKTMFFNLVATI